MYFLDVRPAQRAPLGILCNHEVAEQVTRATKALPYSMDKSPTMDFMEPLTGPSSVLTRQVSIAYSIMISYLVIMSANVCFREKNGKLSADDSILDSHHSIF